MKKQSKKTVQINKKCSYSKSVRHFLKLALSVGLVGSLVIASTLTATAKNKNKNKSKSSTCVTATYPARDSSSCAISDNYEIKTVATSASTTTDIVIFHYEVGNINSGFEVDTSNVCIDGSTVKAVQDLTGSCGGTVYPSRVYFYVSEDISLSGNPGKVSHTAYDYTDNKAVAGIPGAFRIYGNPAGGTAQTFKFSGNTCVPAFIYAPTADTGINGGGNGCGIQGAIWVKSWGEVTSSSNVAKVTVPGNLEANLGYDITNDVGLRVYSTSAATSWKRPE